MVRATESASVTERLKIKRNTIGRENQDLDIDQKMRRSKGTKRQAIDTITKIRNDKQTMVTHEVREQKENGEWETVHKHNK
jgi:hypothetical protein